MSLPSQYESRSGDAVSTRAPPEGAAQLSWSRQDVEQRLGLRGARFTRVNSRLTFLMAAAATVAFYAALTPLAATRVAAMFTERGMTPYFISFFTFWALAILLVKWRKLALQRKSLLYRVVPEDHGFVLSATTVDLVFDRMYATVDEPSKFILFNRIVVALSNLRNLGRVTDVDEILRSQAEHDESIMETSYSLLVGFVWAIPVLGFIGTVLGLSQAIGGFGAVLGESQEVSQIAGSLRTVTGGLATAFETTLEALVAALTIQILLTFLRKSEEEFLDDCAEYCQRHVVNRLRMTPFEAEAN